MGKSKKEKRKSEGGEDNATENGEGTGKSWEERTRYLSPISHPLAPRKLTKKLYKTLKKVSAADLKNRMMSIKLIQKHARTGVKGLLLIAGDIQPIDLISHIPVMCEEAGIPYCYVPSREDLGQACGCKSRLLAFIPERDEYKELYDECVKEVKELPMPL